MLFLYLPNAGESSVLLTGEDFAYIIKARRSRVGDILQVRNLRDGFLYRYELAQIDKKSALLKILDSKEQ